MKTRLFAISAVLLLFGSVLAASAALIVAAPDSGAAPASAAPTQNWSAPTVTPAIAKEIQHSLNVDFTLGIPSWQIIVSGLAGAAVAVGCSVITDGTMAIGCAEIGFGVAIGLTAYFVITFNAKGTVVTSPLYYPGETEASTLLKTYQLQLNQTVNTAVNLGNLISQSTGLYGYEASSAVGPQLGNATYNASVDLVDSGVAQQMLNLLDGAALGANGPIQGFINSWGPIMFGPTGKYGADGIVCVSSGVVKFPTTAGSTFNGGWGPLPLVSGGAAGPDGNCWQSISPANNNISFPLSNASDIAVGLLLPTASAAAPTYNGYNIFLRANATFTFVGNDGIGTEGLVLEGPYPSTVNHTVTLSAYNVTAAGLTPGIYKLYNETVGASSASPTTAAFLGTGVLPLYMENTSKAVALRSMTEIASVGGGNIYFSCGTSVSDVSNVTPLLAGVPTMVNLTNVPQCPTGFANIINQAEAEMLASSFVGQGYFNFMHGLGVFQENTIPQSCQIPTPGDFLPPDTPIATIIHFGPNDIGNMLLAYTRALSNAYYGQNLTSATFCGFHIPPPGNITLNDPNWALIGDIYTKTGAFLTPTSWSVLNTGLIVLPKNGNLTIPVNKIWEAPASNPSVIYYGPTTPPPASLNASNVANATIGLAYGGVFSNFVGNSTNKQGSVFPNATDSRLGTGNALFLTACWHNASGVWAKIPTCYRNVTVLNYTQPTGSNSCYFQFSCTGGAAGGFPLPTIINCGFFLASDFAQPFVNLTVFGIKFGSFACVIGWILTVAVIALIVYVAYITFRAVLRRE